MNLDRPVTPEVEAIDKIFANKTGMVAFYAEWCSHVCYANGSPSVNAIIILADIVYWHRSYEQRDELTGRAVLQRRFEGELLQRSRSYYEKLFKLTNKQVRDAFDLLESLGLIAVEVVDRVTLPDGQALANVSYIRIFPEKIAAITPSEDGGGRTYKSGGSDLQVRRVGPTSPTYTKGIITKNINTAANAHARERDWEAAIVSTLTSLGVTSPKRIPKTLRVAAAADGLNQEQTVALIRELFALEPAPNWTNPISMKVTMLTDCTSLKALLENEKQAAARRRQAPQEEETPEQRRRRKEQEHEEELRRRYGNRIFQ